MTAQEMFEKLGYVREENSDDIDYVNKDKYNVITFCKILKSVSCTDWGRYDAGLINPEELKAINQQCKELRWL